MTSTCGMTLQKSSPQHEKEDTNYCHERALGKHSDLFQPFMGGSVVMNECNGFADANGRPDLKIMIDPADESKKKKTSLASLQVCFK